MISEEFVKEVSSLKGKPCVSIFFDVEMGWDKEKLNKLRFKELISRAESELQKRGWGNSLTEKISTEILNTDFGKKLNGSGGIIIYANEDYFKSINTKLKLETSYYVDERFDIKPLIELISIKPFHILWLNQKGVDLFKVVNLDAESVHDIDLPDPEDVIKQKFSHFSKARQLHQIDDGSKPGHVRHGQGGAKAYKDTAIEEFLKKVDSVVTSYMNKQQTPLILVGSVGMTGVYKDVNHYSSLADLILTMESKNDLDIVVMECREYFKQQNEESLKDKLDSSKPIKVKIENNEALKKLLPLAREGRVKELYLDTQEYCWGEYKEESHHAKIHNKKKHDSEDLFNGAACEVIRLGGKVTALPEKIKTEKTQAIGFLW